MSLSNSTPQKCYTCYPPHDNRTQVTVSVHLSSELREAEQNPAFTRTVTVGCNHSSSFTVHVSHVNMGCNPIMSFDHKAPFVFSANRIFIYFLILKLF